MNRTVNGHPVDNVKELKVKLEALDALMQLNARPRGRKPYSSTYDLKETEKNYTATNKLQRKILN